ncbi:MAG TPA: SurA N-terminal domain-containing protein [Thermodesulfobacteriota bacterium]
MLDAIRQRKTVFLWVILVPIAIVFIFWGIGGQTGGPLGVDVAARVNGTEISAAEVAAEQAAIEERFRQMFGGQLPPGLLRPEMLRAQAVENLVTRVLLEQEAERLDIEVTDEEVRQYILGMPVFQRDGRFDRDTYVAALTQGVMGQALRTPAAFEAAVRQTLAFQKLNRLVAESVSVTEAEARQAFHAERDKVSVEFVRVPARPDPKATFPEDELTAYYEAHKGEYERPAEVTAVVARVDPAKLADTITVSEEDIEAAFERRKDRLGTPPEVNARHILVKVDEHADAQAIEQARARAQAALDRVRKGEDFGKVALEVSEDPAKGSDPKSAGSLGWFGRGVMVKEFEDAAFALEAGQISDLVRSPFGFHVIKVERVREGKPATLEGSRATLEAELKAERARQQAGELADQLAVAAARSGDLAGEAKLRDIPTRTVGPFTAAAPPSDLPAEAARAALRLEQGRVSAPVADGAAWVVVQVTGKTEATTPPLADVMDRVKAGLAREKAVAAARQQAASVLEAARKDGNLAAAARAAGLRVERTGLFERRTREIPKLGPAPAVAEAAFRLTEETPLPPEPVQVGDDAVVLRLAERQAADPSADPDTLARITRALEQEKGNAAFRAFVERLRRQAKIRIDPLYAPKAPSVPLG